MAEATKYLFTYEELVEALIKQQDLHQGTWAIYMEFGIQGTNAAGGAPGEVFPVAVVPVVKVGLQQVAPDAKLPGVLDAAMVNPRPKATSRGRGES